MTPFTSLLKEKKNFIFIGEAGSGKSEISLNTAVLLQKIGRQNIHLFDMDQTKAMFRSRDAKEEMETLGISVHYMPQLLDTPVMVNGIIPHLVRKDSASVLDVGGNDNASRMIGCLSDYLNGENTAAIYVINPYRPWSGTPEGIQETMQSVLASCHIEKVFFVANPTVGGGTSPEDVSAGLEQLFRVFPLENLSGIFLREDLFSQFRALPGIEYIPLHQYLIYPWSINKANLEGKKEI